MSAPSAPLIQATEQIQPPSAIPLPMPGIRGQKLPRLLVTAGVFLVCMTVPLIVYNQLSKVLDDKSKSWFIYHPVLMATGVIGLPLAAILQQRLFGYKSNKYHMYSMMISYALVAIGAFVIITSKRSQGETHFASGHAIMGLITIILLTGQATMGLLALDRDNRISFFRSEMGSVNMRRFLNVRWIHTIGGRGILIAGYVTALLGWTFFFAKDAMKMTFMAVALSGLSAIALYDPIVDFIRYQKTRRPGLSVGRGA